MHTLSFNDDGNSILCIIINHLGFTNKIKEGETAKSNENGKIAIYVKRQRGE